MSFLQDIYFAELYDHAKCMVLMDEHFDVVKRYGLTESSHFPLKIHQLMYTDQTSFWCHFNTFNTSLWLCSSKMTLQQMHRQSARGAIFLPTDIFFVPISRIVELAMMIFVKVNVTLYSFCIMHIYLFIYFDFCHISQHDLTRLFSCVSVRYKVKYETNSSYTSDVD